MSSWRASMIVLILVWVRLIFVWIAERFAGVFALASLASRAARLFTSGSSRGAYFALIRAIATFSFTCRELRRLAS